LLTRRNKKYVLKESIKKNGRYIVSFTSFPARINNVWLVVESILRQTQKPDMIILWLSKKQFSSLDVLPKSLLNLQKRGLTIKLKDEDFRSHKKYYYFLKEYSEDYLITIDDDIFYRSDMLKTLFDYSIKYPNRVISNYSHILCYEDKKLLSYEQVDRNIKCECVDNANLFFGSGGGTLFPPYCFFSDILNIDLAMKLCPIADDVWLNAMVRLNKRKVVKTNYFSVILPILKIGDIKLYESNQNGGNDSQILAVNDYYYKFLGRFIF